MQEKQNIGKLFDRIAHSYDKLNHLLSFNIDKTWRRKAIYGMLPSERVLDVAIGTADLAIELIRQNKAQSVVGIDVSPKMMAMGKAKLNRLKMSQIEFLEASALDIPFDRDTFDAVTCAYGVRNFSDLDKGLNEMYRVMKQGGQLMILEFAYPSNRIVAGCYDFYFSHILPWLGRIISRDKFAYTYLNHSVKQFIWGDAMCERLQLVGFSHVQYQTISLGITTIYRAQK